MRRALVLATLALSAAAVGCGAERQRAPDPDKAVRPAGFGQVFYGAAGLRFQAPRNWSQNSSTAPLVATVSSGRAVMAFWRYPRREPLPQTREQLQPLVKALVEAARARDPALTIESSRIVRVAGANGIELAGLASVGAEPRRVRSLHLFDHRAEVVVDAYAPSADFDQLNRTVFGPVISSLKLFAPIGP